MRPATLLLITVAASACASSAVSEPRTAKAEMRLQELLGDKVRLFAMSGYAPQHWPEAPQIFEKYLLKPVTRATIRDVIGE